MLPNNDLNARFDCIYIVEVMYCGYLLPARRLNGQSVNLLSQYISLTPRLRVSNWIIAIKCKFIESSNSEFLEYFERCVKKNQQTPHAWN